MGIRLRTIRSIHILAQTSSTFRRPLLQRLSTQSQVLSAPIAHCSHPSRPRIRYNHTGAPSSERTSSTGFYTAVVLVGVAIGGALLFPIVKSGPEVIAQIPSTAGIDYSTLEDSYLIMAPNTPPGRPGTLTPEEEEKLRELWAVTMRVFGAYEPAAVEINGTETPIHSSTDLSETSGKKDKDKRKSRLHVFKRNKDKGDKDGSESVPGSGTATPSDISQLPIADEDDKHGQNKEFKAALADTSPEELRNTFWSMTKLDHPDGLLLRYLRARKWDVNKALVMMISTMHWRATDIHVDDDIIRHGELGAVENSKSNDPKVKREGEDFLAQLRMGKSFLHGLDKEGRPLCIVRARLHRQGEQSEASLEKFTVYTIETARLLLRPPVDTATIIFDMTGFSMANMDYAPVKFMIKCFEANYPESLGAVLVYKAPWVFNAIWNIIRGWLDPVVAGKVHFAKHIEDLEQYIPRSQIPADLGGDEKWEYKYVEPDPNENQAMADETKREELQTERKALVKKYESTILDWCHASAGAKESKSIEERRQERDSVAEELRQNYWKLDPYLRARTLYDRTGVIREGGKLDFYGTQKESVPPATAPPQAAEETHPDLD